MVVLLTFANSMKVHRLNAISPVDGRYAAQTEELRSYFSEAALMRYRVWVEIEYFIAICSLGLKGMPVLSSENVTALRDMVINFGDADVFRIKDQEAALNHDIKAVEYFLREKFTAMGLQNAVEFIHFGLTSQDINNTAIPASLRDAEDHVLEPNIEALIHKLTEQAALWSDITLLARTHGQPASPTSLGKEWYVFVERLNEQLIRLQEIPHNAKLGGATGNFNAHYAAYPQTDWPSFADEFVNVTLGLRRSRFTTQIEHYDNLAARLDGYRRINTILIDFTRDVWSYISLGYFRQRTVEGEIGSSAMPHKVNPIDFENAEGNLGLANALLSHLSEKLPVSRLQRDLTDSTVLRNLGVPLAHMLIAFKSITRGLNKLMLDESKIASDLEQNWAVVAEAIQTVLRRENYPHPYEALRQLTRGKAHIHQNDIHTFIDSLQLSDALKEELKSFTPANYRGVDLLSSEW
jgi:adenylosuccinate lyase